jgi:hypothetical protein
MRKRSSYRPKPEMVNPLLYVLESFTPVRAHDSYLIDLKIKNHGAMSNLTRGIAVRQDIDTLISMGNLTEALYRLGFGREYGDVVLHDAQMDLITVKDMEKAIEIVNKEFQLRKMKRTTA